MLSINISEVIWTIINFFLLLFLLKKFLYTPIINFMDERNERIAKAMKAKSDAVAEQNRSEAELSEKLEQVRGEARRIVTAGKTENDRVRSEFVKKANAEELSNRKEMKLELGREKETLMQELEASEAELAAALAEKLLSE